MSLSAHAFLFDINTHIDSLSNMDTDPTHSPQRSSLSESYSRVASCLISGSDALVNFRKNSQYCIRHTTSLFPNDLQRQHCEKQAKDVLNIQHFKHHCSNLQGRCLSRVCVSLLRLHCIAFSGNCVVSIIKIYNLMIILIAHNSEPCSCRQFFVL